MQEGRKFFIRHKILIGLIGIFCLANIGLGIYFLTQYKKNPDSSNSPGAAAVAEDSALLEKVLQIMDLPTGETPRIAIVSDATKLQGQPFFAHARNGDNVIIYTKEKEAILYDPVRNKIVNVAPITIQAPTVSITPSASPSASPIESKR